jgi:DNA-binding response OmpR family regulator
MSMAKLLIVEDDALLLDLLSKHMRDEGHVVISATRGDAAIEIARHEIPDLCIIDVMMPGLDGLSVCRIIRRESDVPIILLTARASEMDRVIGLDSGADDYVTKPFGMPELTARVRAALRRAPKRSNGKLAVGDIEIDLVGRRVYKRQSEVKLSNKEFELLTTLLRNKGAVLSRDYLITQVWGNDFAGDMRTVDVHMRWLREKLEDDPSTPNHLQTVRGVGYRVG